MSAHFPSGPSTFLVPSRMQQCTSTDTCTVNTRTQNRTHNRRTLFAYWGQRAEKTQREGPRQMASWPGQNRKRAENWLPLEPPNATKQKLLIQVIRLCCPLRRVPPLKLRHSPLFADQIFPLTRAHRQPPIDCALPPH